MTAPNLFDYRVGGSNARITAGPAEWSAGRPSSRKAAQAERVAEVLASLGSATADEIAEHLPDIELGTVATRVSQLCREGRALRTTQRRRTRSGSSATVVVPFGGYVDPGIKSAPGSGPTGIWIARHAKPWSATNLAKYEMQLAEVRAASYGRRGLLAKKVAALAVSWARRGGVNVPDAEQRLAEALSVARRDDPEANTAAEARRAFRAAIRPLLVGGGRGA